MKRKCQLQHGMEMSEEWCESAQCYSLCRGCQYNEGRDKSKYQVEEREKDD